MVYSPASCNSPLSKCSNSLQQLGTERKQALAACATCLRASASSSSYCPPNTAVRTILYPVGQRRIGSGAGTAREDTTHKRTRAVTLLRHRVWLIARATIVSHVADTRLLLWLDLDQFVLIYPVMSAVTLIIATLRIHIALCSLASSTSLDAFSGTDKAAGLFTKL